MQRVRENALCSAMAAAGCAALAWLGLYGFAWTDYDTEARPAFEALAHGHPLAFLQLAPAYGGSLVERAPFALIPGLWGGGELAVYRLVALPCLLASAILGVYLLTRMRRAGSSTLARAVTLGLCVANPITLYALELGHPEELLGACLCVGAVLAGARGRGLWAGLLLGLAIANKEWALIALGPVLLALEPRRRGACLGVAVAVSGAILGTLALGSSGGFAGGTRAVASTASTIFQPWQLWWFVGHHGALVHGAYGTPKPGYRIGPEWTGLVSHPLIIAVGAALAVSLWLRRARHAALAERDALLALALVMLLRCLLDTWDTVYYALPFVLALLAFESRSSRLPLLALSSTALVWLSFQWLPQHASADVQAAAFLGWSLPLLVVVAAMLYAPSRLTDTRRSRAPALRKASSRRPHATPI